MRIIAAEIQKELLLLFRDKAGLALLFIMPVLLVVVMTYIQDATFRAISTEGVEVLWIDQDQSKLSQKIKDRLNASGHYSLVDPKGEDLVNAARNEIAEGKYQVGILIPAGFEKHFKHQVKGRVDSLLNQFGIGDSLATKKKVPPTVSIRILFDPLTQANFKSGIENGLRGYINEVETKISFQVFQARLSAQFPYNPSGPSKDLPPLIQMEDEYVYKGGLQSLPSSTQHNIPAWTVFAIFFIVVSFSQRIVEERNSGVNSRLLSLPAPAYQLYLGKSITYIVISLTQTLLILLIGFYVIPWIGLPKLKMNGSLLILLLFSVTVSLASSGLALLLGEFARTRDQAASFGSVGVIILAALGGVWVPEFAMPSALQTASHISPLNWALNGYYSIIIRGEAGMDLALNAGFLILFFGCTFGLSIWRKQQSIG